MLKQGVEIGVPISSTDLLDNNHETNLQPIGEFMAAIPVDEMGNALVLRKDHTEDGVSYKAGVEQMSDKVNLNMTSQMANLTIRENVPINCIQMEIGGANELVDVRNQLGRNVDGMWLDLNEDGQYDHEHDLFIPEHRLLDALSKAISVQGPDGKDIALAYVRGIQKDHLLIFEDNQYGGEKILQDYLRDTIAMLTLFDNNSEKRGEETKGYRDIVHGFGGYKQLFDPERLDKMPLPELKEVAKGMLKAAVKYEDVIKAEVLLCSAAGIPLDASPFLYDYLYKDSKIDDLIDNVEQAISKLRQQMGEKREELADRIEELMPDEAVVSRFSFAVHTGNALLFGGILATGTAISPISAGALLGGTSVTLLISLLKLRDNLKEKKQRLARQELEEVRRGVREDLKEDELWWGSSLGTEKNHQPRVLVEDEDQRYMGF